MKHDTHSPALLKPGVKVRIAIEKNGYWTKYVYGTFLGYTTAWRCRVRSSEWGGKTRTFKRKNVEAKHGN